MTSCENILQILRAKLKESEKQNKCLKSLLIVQKDQARELREDFVDVSKIIIINVLKFINIIASYVFGNRRLESL